MPSFELAVHSVTVAQYARFLEETKREPPFGWLSPGFDDPRQPVTGVSWFDAKAYCDWLGPRFHLPTEPQREWAARGGLDDPEWPWGDEPPTRPGPLERPDVVGGRPNGYGLCNMGDGVHEWCAEWADASHERRAARGGSWRHATPFSRCAARSALDPSKRFTDFGFRVAASDGFVYDAG